MYEALLKGTRVKKIEYLGKMDVYNMEVEKYHNYSVEGGLIIHNCLDGTRYIMEEFMMRGNRHRGITKSMLGL